MSRRYPVGSWFGTAIPFREGSTNTKGAGSIIEDVKRVFCTNLKNIREQKNLTQSRLSELCHYDRTYVGKIERGDIDPSLEAIARLAGGLGVRVVDLFRDREKHDPEKLFAVIRDLPKKQRQQYRSRFQDPLNMVAILDREGTVLEVNASITRFRKMDHVSMVDEPLWEVEFWNRTNVSPKRIQAEIGRVLEGEDVHMDFPIEFENGEAIRTCFSLTTVPNRRREVEFVVAELHQIFPRTPRKSTTS